jgi:hypothetical protein
VVPSSTVVASVTGAVGSVTGAVGSVTGAVGSVTGSVGSVATGGIAAASFAAGAIDAAAIATDAIGAAEIAADAIGASEIAASAIGASELATDAIGAAELASDATTEIQSGLSTLTAANVWAWQLRVTLTGHVRPATCSSQVIRAVWDGLRSGHTTTGTFGAGVIVQTNNDKTGYTASTVSDKTGYSLSQAFPTNFSSLAITGGGAVTAGTVSDKTGYSLTTAPLTSSQTASAVLDAVASSYNTAGSVGAKINSAAAAGDPWGTALPGSYSSGTGGYILGNLLSSLNSAHGSGAWGSTSASGANTVNLTISNGTTGVPNAVVTVYGSDGVTLVDQKYTGTSGTVAFALNSASYKISIGAVPGYSSSPCRTSRSRPIRRPRLTPLQPLSPQRRPRHSLGRCMATCMGRTVSPSPGRSSRRPSQIRTWRRRITFCSVTRRYPRRRTVWGISRCRSFRARTLPRGLDNT